MGEPVEIQMVRLEGSLGEITRRLDQSRIDQERRHSDNVERLERIELEVRKTNGRVTTLEALSSNRWPSFQVWLLIVGGTGSVLWFVLTTVLGFHR